MIQKAASWSMGILMGLLTVFPVGAQPRNKIYERYIQTYKDIAIAHQRKYKIPASVTLAQGLLESGAGTGTLARKSNNHFGIKCHDWKGPRFYYDDDKENECFRKYRHPRESYEDHSRFLTERSRYASLFKLRSTDYKGWARGLQRCGYATDKAYASKLIDLIELYDLHQYDGKGGDRRKQSRLPEGYLVHPVYKSSGLLYILGREGDDPELIAREFGRKKKQLFRDNDWPADYRIRENDIIYLEKKNKKAAKAYPNHTIRIGESMHAIAQRYGIRLENLYKMNKKNPDYRPRPGDVLKLR